MLWNVDFAVFNVSLVSLMSVMRLGMDMSGFNNVVNAMMMSPTIQAAMNPFLMSGNGNAFLNQLLAAGQGFQNLGAMPPLSTKMLNQLWAMNNVEVCRTFIACHC